MPEIGRPAINQKNPFSEVAMAPKREMPKQGKIGEEDAGESDRRQQVIEKVNGRQADPVFKKGPHNQIGKDEFLKLLSHQLQNQDPMNPMDQNKFAAELAQFSQLEQLSNLNSKFDAVIGTGATENKFYAASFLGKEVVTSGTSVELKEDGQKSEVLFNLSDNAFKTHVKIMDSKNNMVSEMWLDALPKGAQKIAWDGLQLDKAPARKGNYNIQIEAWNDKGDKLMAETKVKGTVESVFFENGETVMMVDGKKLFLRDVESFHLPDGEQKNLASKNNLGSLEQMRKSVQAGLPMNNNLPAVNAPAAKVNLGEEGIRSYQKQQNAPLGI